MKTLRYVFLTLGVLAFISCNNTTKNEDELGTETADSYETTTADRNMDGTDVMATDNANNHTITQTSSWNTQDMTKMYADLNMTRGQIEDFESDYRQKQNVRSSDNIVDSNHVDLQMDESLKKVLSPEQYAKYQEWKKSNTKE